MRKINKDLREELIEKFGSRVSFRAVERKLYGHDIASIPSLIRPFVGNTIPEVVVQPQTIDEVVELVHMAYRHNIPITPRGKATSGYGGVIPVKKGMVVDFYYFNAIKNIDKESLTVTVEPGIVWEKLDNELQKKGLTLRLYPSSYPSATVGGWLAQGGVGIGSFEAGWFRNNVTSAKIILPDGKLQEFMGDDIDLISDAEGITGLIVEVTLQVQPLEELGVLAIGCSSADDLQKIFQEIIQRNLPLWSVLFINPKMAELRNQAPLMEHLEEIVEERVTLPVSYITTITFRERDRDTIQKKLPEILESNSAELLDEYIAQHEWGNRFKIMLVKRLGPSLVPSEVVIPLDSLGDVLQEIEEKVDQPLVKEGVVIREGVNGEPEIAILGFILSDQRLFSYNFVFGLVITIIKIAEKHGGRPYCTGLYFTKKVNKILSRKTANLIRAYKKKIDPKSLLNPGKVISGGFISIFMSVAQLLEPLLRIFGNKVATRVGERPDKPVRGIPGDVAWYAYGCSQCGCCVDECDQFYGRGWESQSPRGKWYWLREYMEGREEWDQFMVDTFLVCTTCELCNLRCSALLPIEPSWMKMRGQLIQEEKRMTIPPFEMMSAALETQGNIWAGYRKDRTNWFPEELWDKHGTSHKAKMAYFAGCTASHVETDIAIASVCLLDAAGIDFTYAGERENCCGTPMLVCGKWDVFAETMKKNIEAVTGVGADTVITSCPACDMMWRHIYPKWANKLGIEFNITAKHYSEVIADKINKGGFSFPDSGNKIKVTLHDSCHIGRVSSVYDAPRDFIKAIPGVELVEMEHNREWAHCCGSVLTLIKDPVIAVKIGEHRMDEAIATGAEKLLALCPCCQFQFRVTAEKKGISMETIDLATFAAEHMGFNLPDPNPEVQRQWAVFEAMISLMSPEGFATLMGTMWDELIDAMPLGMGKMMRGMGKIPGTLTLMKPLFPVLFPKLLPLMMPKVMPVMLEKIKAAIPMPDYMQEQMPSLMPKVMDNLMPHMIGSVVPLIIQPMISHLQGKNIKNGNYN